MASKTADRLQAASVKRAVVRHRRFRRSVQAIFAALFVACFLLAAGGITGLVPVDLWFFADPLLSGSALLAGRRLLPPALLAGTVLLAATAVFGRFFCGYLCPMGFCLDLTARGGPRPSRTEGGRWVKHALLALLLAAAAFGLPLAHLFDPLVILWRGLTLAVYPLLLSTGDFGLGMLRSLTESVGPTTPFLVALPQRIFAGTAFSLALLLGVLATNRIAPRFWCRVLCPLGALLGLAAGLSWLRRVPEGEACLECGRCARECPMGLLGSGPEAAPAAECLLCLGCAKSCPLGAIHLRWRAPWRDGRTVAEGVPGAQAPQAARVALDRRRLLAGVGCGLAGALVLDRVAWAGGGKAAALRPPGSLSEEEFLEQCLRCGVCLQACPTNVLQPDLLPDRLEGLFAPRLDMERGGCDPECNACGTVCPSQAILALPLAEKRQAVIGKAVVDGTRCLRGTGEDCRICAEACPYQAVEIGSRVKPAVLGPRCNGCGLCEFRCPVTGTAAIHVVAPGEAVEPPGAQPDESHLPPFLRGS